MTEAEKGPTTFIPTHRIGHLDGRVVAERLGLQLGKHVSGHYSNGGMADFVSCEKLGCVEMRPTAREAYLMYLDHGSLVAFNHSLKTQDLGRDVIRFNPGDHTLVGETIAESVR